MALTSLTGIIPIALIVIVFWLVGISFFLFQEARHYRKMTAGTEKKTLKEILEKLLTQQQKTKDELNTVSRQLAALTDIGKLHVQKVGIVRFNPFADTGGKQSFVIALLDWYDSGVILSSLFSRTGTRWYVKQVKNSKGVEQKLSQEEKEAIQNADATYKTFNKNNKKV